MSFVFATSHLPAVKRLHEEEEEEEVRPMLRSGSVRAFSHLREPVRGDPAGAVSLRGTVKTGRQLQRVADAGRSTSSSPPAPDDTRPWHSPAITREDLMPEGGGEDEEEYDPAPGFSPPRGAPGPQHDPDPGFAISAPPEWGEPTRDAGFEHSKQDMRNGLRDADADTAAGENAAQGRAPLPYGRLFEKRPTPAKPEFSDLVYRTQGEHANRPRNSSGMPGATWVAVKAPAQQQGARKAQPSPQTRPASAAQPSPQKPAQGPAPTPPAPGNAAAPKNVGAGSLAAYRQQTQEPKKRLEALQAARTPSTKDIKAVQKQIASTTRNMESIHLAVQLMNSMKQEGETDIDPETIDEDSAEFKSKVQTAIKRLHGGTAPWMDHLAANFGEREKTKNGSANPRLVEALSDPKPKLKIDPTAAAWCGYALGTAMGKAGIPPPKTASWAGNWRGWGQDSAPKAGGLNVGDVYHIKYAGKEGFGHVATVVGVSKDGTQVFCLGGNQNDGLNISAYPIGEFKEGSTAGTYKDATTAFKKPLGQRNNKPAPTFDFNADPSTFDILAGFTR